MKKTSADTLAKKLNISSARASQSIIKANLITIIIKEAKKQDLTHAELAERSGLARTTVTGILSGSLQKVTIDRILRLIEAVNLEAEIKIKKAA